MSSTEARYSLPSPVGISVPSPYHFWLIPSAAKPGNHTTGKTHRLFSSLLASNHARPPGDRRSYPARIAYCSRCP
jgi:hypothetical protein